MTNPPPTYVLMTRIITVVSVKLSHSPLPSPIAIQVGQTLLLIVAGIVSAVPAWRGNNIGGLRPQYNESGKSSVVI